MMKLSISQIFLIESFIQLGYKFTINLFYIQICFCFVSGVVPGGPYGVPPPPGGYGSQPYGQPPPQGGYGAPPPAGGYGGPPPTGSYGVPPGGYGGVPPSGGYGGHPPASGYGAQPPQAGYGSHPGHQPSQQNYSSQGKPISLKIIYTHII